MLLVCFNPGGVSFETLHCHGMKRKLWEVMTACVIMHNMIVEDERPERLYDQGFQFQGENVVPEHGVAATFKQFTQFYEDMRDWETHV